VRYEESKKRGMLRGLRLANAIEAAACPVPEDAELRFKPSGSAMLLMRTKAHGPGHETAVTQILRGPRGLDRPALQSRREPAGCHVCEVEIDPETGAVSLVGYVVVDDVGTVINPLTLRGQVHGGLAQGIGQILMEQVAYDRQSGQLLSASFMDYAMPRADVM